MLHPAVLSGARWFWWIAGLSLVNIVLFYAGSETSFVIGLAMSSVVSAMFEHQVAIGATLALATVAFYAIIGLYAQKGQRWAFYVGLAVYAVDALIYIMVGDWMPVAFHAYAIYQIAQGLMAIGHSVEVVAEPAAEVAGQKVP